MRMSIFAVILKASYMSSHIITVQRKQWAKCMQLSLIYCMWDYVDLDGGVFNPIGLISWITTMQMPTLGTKTFSMRIQNEQHALFVYIFRLFFEFGIYYMKLSILQLSVIVLILEFMSIFAGHRRHELQIEHVQIISRSTFFDQRK